MNDLKQMTEAEMREMDVAVAEKVMGWKSTMTRPPHWRPTMAIKNLIDGVTTQPYAGPWLIPPDMFWEDSPDNGVEVPAYTADIAHAWSVVEKMRDTNPQIGFRLDVGPGILVDGKSYQFSAMFFYAGCGPWKVHIGADTAPLAICLAAISALEAKKGQQP